MKSNALNFSLMLSIATLAIILLVGLRLDARFAGQPGFQTHAPFTINEHTVERGDTLSTTKSYAVATHPEATLYLDKNTRLRFDDGRAENLQLTLEDGRLLGNGQFTISSRTTKISINGRATIVHYPWLNTLTVLLLSGTGSLDHQGDVANISINNALSINTLAPGAQPQNTEFSLTTPAVMDFYHFAEQSQE